MSSHVIIEFRDVKVTARKGTATDPVDGGKWKTNASGDYVVVGNVIPPSAQVSAQVSYLDAKNDPQTVAGKPTDIPKGYDWAFSFALPTGVSVSIQVAATTDTDVGSLDPPITSTPV
jgi:hypothetical protein